MLGYRGRSSLPWKGGRSWTPESSSCSDVGAGVGVPGVCALAVSVPVPPVSAKKSAADRRMGRRDNADLGLMLLWRGELHVDTPSYAIIHDGG